MGSGQVSDRRDTVQTMSEETLATLRRGYDAYNRGDPLVTLKVAEDVATADVEWGATGAFPGVGRVYRGL